MVKGAAVAPETNRGVPREGRDEREVGVPRHVASVVAVPGQAFHLNGPGVGVRVREKGGSLLYGMRPESRQVHGAPDAVLALPEKFLDM